jgi:ABC-type lipoprotein release transport system permease subunit
VLARALAAVIWGVPPNDPAVFGGMTLALGAAVILATLVPARRALEIDPGRVLRDE